jgi:hypothetical protein
MLTDRVIGFRGEIELFLRYPDGREEILLRKSNTVLNSGMDLLAKALGNDLYINGMYFAYDNAGVPYTDPTPPKERTASFYHSDGGGTRNFVRVPTLALPSYAATDPAYNSNKAIFVGITSGAGVLAGAGNVLTDGLSQFYGAGIGWLHATDYQQDILYAAVSFDDLGPSHFEKIAGAQLGLRWGLFVETP